MKAKVIIGILVVVILAAVGAALMVGRPPAPLRLAPSWQLLSKGTYRAMGVTDPFMSWSPDSRSVLFSVFGLKSQQNKLFRWKVGENKIDLIADGLSPNFVSSDEFLYLRGAPKAICRRSLTTGREQEIGAALKKLDMWNDITSFTYNPERRSVVLRMAEFAQFTTAGGDEYDLSGKRLGAMATRQCDDIVDFSRSPDGSRCAIMVQKREDQPISLQLASGNECRGKELTRGMLIGHVAWSPDGKSIAYGDGKIVVLLNPDGKKRAVVGVFGDPDDKSDRRCVARLMWSPNSQYLAVFVYVPDKNGDYPLYYMLDMSRLK